MSKRANKTALIRVKDSGNGIEAGVQARLFEPLLPTQSADRGTGLGLNPCRSILEGFSGSIELDTQCPNTCFVIRLPKA